MRKIFILSLLACVLFVYPAFAMIVTDNVDKDAFQYEIGYKFATSDLAVSVTLANVPVESRKDNNVVAYTVPRSGRVVGIAVTGETPIVRGAATFDVTINGTVTGIQAVIEPTGATARTAVGAPAGAASPQYAYTRQDRAETNAAKGFKRQPQYSNSYFHNADNPYGRATPLTAGNRVGVQVTTSSNLTPLLTDFVVVIYVLE